MWQLEIKTYRTINYVALLQYETRLLSKIVTTYWERDVQYERKKNEKGERKRRERKERKE